MKTALKHWMTSVAGVLSGGLLAATGQHDWKHFLLAAGVAMLGLAAKDANK